MYHYLYYFQYTVFLYYDSFLINVICLILIIIYTEADN